VVTNLTLDARSENTQYNAVKHRTVHKSSWATSHKLSPVTDSVWLGYSHWRTHIPTESQILIFLTFLAQK